MEFNEKLQELRKQKGLTQEELAQALFVSRTAISKWESGRGYPNLDSLKALAKFFCVTVDELLSGEQVMTIAEKDRQESRQHTQDLVYGMLDFSTILLLFLPFFGQASEGSVQAVSLLALAQTAPWLKAAYGCVIGAMSICGLALLALQNWDNELWKHHKKSLSLGFNVLGALLFILSKQPYPATLLFVFLAVKAFMLIKKQ